VLSDDIHPVYPPAGTTTGDPTISHDDISDLDLSTTGAILSDVIGPLAADHWHHALIAVELKPIAAIGLEPDDETISGIEGEYIDVACRLFIAVDDVNYTGYDLSTYYPLDYSDLNGVVTKDALRVAGHHGSNEPEGGSAPAYSIAAPEVPSSGEAIGIPATTDFTDRILPVEMAELQIFVDVVLDTGDEANRRAFIDADGVPVPPIGPRVLDPATGEPILDDDGNPVRDPAPAEALLGKKPEVLLHGSGNWIVGNNTGAADEGLDPDTGEPVADPGDFTPTGQIVAYMPGPSLYGEQSPP
jgi:hypothetical protein